MIRSDLSKRKALEEQLRVRALQQAGLARLSQLALAGRPMKELADEAVTLVAESLGVEYAVVLQLLKDQGEFLMVAGFGWHEPVGQFVMAATREWQTGYSLDSQTPVAVVDYQNEHRFSRSPLIRSHAIQSAVTVAIRTDQEPYGVLGAYQTASRTFSDDDIYFLQYLANILADADRHQKFEAALRQSEHRFRAQYQRLPLATFAWQHAGSGDFVFVDYNEAADQLTKNGIAAMIGKWATEIYAECPAMLEMMCQAFNEQRHMQHEFREYVMYSTGEVKDVAVTNSFVPPDFLLMYVDDVTYRKRDEAEILASHERLRALSSRLITIQEEERKRIAREVHDELGQGLTALKLNVASLLQSLPPEQHPVAVPHVNRINALIDRSIGEVRRIASELRPSVLDDFGLTAAVQLATEDFQSDTGIECDVSIHPEEIEATPAVAIVIYRILQEALANVARHAHAKRADVRLRQDEQRLALEVRDNGSGIADSSIDDSRSLGLIGMRERAALIGGTLRIERISGAGTIVSLSVPVDTAGRLTA